MISNINKANFTVIVDADACPVLDIVIRAGLEKSVPVVLVASIAHNLPKTPGIERVTVDSYPQAVDLAIINRVKPQDIVVTQDFGLASLVLAKGARAISNRGMIYREDNIDTLLAQRHISAKIRQAGGRTKGPKSHKPEDSLRFEANLHKLIAETVNKSSSLKS